uniref:Immunoglobulin domain-containing protein n=1 Tax=Dicentrarchus labrax TaxID=13489 RepID=A0A8P4KIG2_DICLA
IEPSGVSLTPLALCGGDSGLVSARLNLYTGAVGGSGTLECTLRLSGSNKFFCKKECKAEDILIKTDGVRAHSGRYSIKYRNDSPERGILSVTITNLTKSDSGRYRCGLGQTLVPGSYRDFEIRVSDGEFLLKIIKLDIFSVFNIFSEFCSRKINKIKLHCEKNGSYLWCTDFLLIVVTAELCLQIHLISYQSLSLMVSFLLNLKKMLLYNPRTFCPVNINF